jgi:conjugative relaxase-like TrwC/TraI family protein
MVLISKALSARQACAYHREQFANAVDNYFTTRDRIAGRWRGALARRWGLAGEVREEQFRRLAEGRHPATGDVLVRTQTPTAHVNRWGQTVRTMVHRAGWDAVISAPKSVSLTALVGGDEAVAAAYRESVIVTVDELERSVQARSRTPVETTRNWAAALFEHDSTRPVGEYAAPHLHTHVVFFNMTETASGRIRPVDACQLFKSQRYATAVYLSELAHRLQDLGYRIDRKSNGQPEIHGYTAEYLRASSPRHQQIVEHRVSRQRDGPGAAILADYVTRAPKIACSHEQMQRGHRELAAAFGDEAARVVQASRLRSAVQLLARPFHAARAGGRDAAMRAAAEGAITAARDRRLERHAVVDERALLRDALAQTMGGPTVADLRAELDRRLRGGELVMVEKIPGAAARWFTTPELIALDREMIDMMRAGRETLPAVRQVSASELRHRHPNLGEEDRAVVERVLRSQDKIVALQNLAGLERTATLDAVCREAERAGYRVIDRATHSTHSTHWTYSTHSTHPTHSTCPTLFVLADWNLTRTRQVHDFLRHLGRSDRVLMVGNNRPAWSAGSDRPYRRLLDSGMLEVGRESQAAAPVLRTPQRSHDIIVGHAHSREGPR